MNVILKAWRKFKIGVVKRRLKNIIGSECKFQIGDCVHVKDQSFDLTGSKFYSFRGTGEVVDAFYGYQMNKGHKWYYEVCYKTESNTHTITYEEHEICIDVAWIRAKRLKKLGI
jgi:hypothetical protein